MSFNLGQVRTVCIVMLLEMSPLRMGQMSPIIRIVIHARFAAKFTDSAITTDHEIENNSSMSIFVSTSRAD